ncbi:sensor histidine kinase [Dictyobacter formicarum]|uniref:histidine kinase n=1 Tax=Dictyobacter formicarum TaxID=2778368 RepID=A0ABQ3VEI0_9CHLR|nr:HAMP domain-containing sensor histidine kinase [Dictyobacter formicarum]GHO83793.1 hypothetical protein KSZ_17990 [Dictyobacter formicarum]
MQRLLYPIFMITLRAYNVFWHKPLFGYIASVLLIAAMVLLKYVDIFLAKAPYFAIAPMGLVSTVVALSWGIGPGLFSLALGLLATQYFIVPGIFTPDIGRDTAIGGPFVAVDFIVIVLVARLAVVNQQLIRANQDLGQSANFKDQFIARATHELRTPLTTIRGQAQLALRRLRNFKDEVSQATIQRHFEKMDGRAADMQLLLDDLLDLNSLRAGTLPLHFGTCDMVEIAQDVVAEQREVSNRAITFNETGSRVSLYADKKRLSQVVTNLISNAIKYSTEDTVITVDVDQGPREVVLRVHNEGPQLSATSLSRAFDIFYRAPEAEATQTGWGIGLTISREIVEQHHGRIWAEASPGGGATFFVAIPV